MKIKHDIENPPPMGVCRSCGHIICHGNRWYCFVIARGFPENINIKQCTGYKEVEHAECAFHLHGGHRHRSRRLHSINVGDSALRQQSV